MEKTQALGRRKEASARVTFVAGPGTGTITVNGLDHKAYFPQSIYQLIVEQPFKLLELTGKYNLIVTAIGGGVKGQAEAIRLGISRGLLKIDPEYRPKLKAAGFLTRDPRS